MTPRPMTPSEKHLASLNPERSRRALIWLFEQWSKTPRGQEAKRRAEAEVAEERKREEASDSPRPNLLPSVPEKRQSRARKKTQMKRETIIDFCI